MTDPADMETEDVRNLAALLDRLIEKPVRAVVDPALEHLKRRLNVVEDGFGPLREMLEEQQQQLGDLGKTSGTMQSQIAIRHQALEKELSVLSQAQAELRELVAEATVRHAERAQADAHLLGRQLLILRLWILASSIAVVLASIVVQLILRR
jgi:hypothetical protein